MKLESEEDLMLCRKSYAVLSHVWIPGGREITFDESKVVMSKEKAARDKDDLETQFQTLSTQNEHTGRPELLNAIKMAEKLKYTYLWIDTCCINKSNHTELAEAISSMADWYTHAEVCLVYLDDFEPGPSKLDLLSDAKTRWATRGWTLQEIVTCRRAMVFNRNWEQIACLPLPAFLGSHSAWHVVVGSSM
ncbi:heterokaryon incompatibility protein-domain-containing protein [Sphaerosporella brunnea]|uniref:Heterokaryon incompatibility protein-domain-containing protein n=1 Tax=Sphaerosporella brunnea TaxID=1250544 RepID=A0A5J5F681_9PEZI|nr:heterokaryon incompatibility protein-domain-containing protein [Sphaerosporella brunnea]